MELLLLAKVPEDYASVLGRELLERLHVLACRLLSPSRREKWHTVIVIDCYH